MIASWKSRSTLSWPPIALFTPKAAVTHAGTGPRRHVSNPSSSRCGRHTDTAHWTRPSVWATCQDTVWSDLDQSLHRNQLLTNDYYLSIHPSIHPYIKRWCNILFWRCFNQESMYWAFKIDLFYFKSILISYNCGARKNHGHFSKVWNKIKLKFTISKNVKYFKYIFEM